MRGSTYKVCRSCTARKQWRRGDRRCPSCGSTEFSWYYSVDLGDDPGTGRRRLQRRGGFSSQEEAQRALDHARRNAHRSAVLSTRRTLGEYLDEWMAARRTSVGPSRWHNDGRYIEQHIRPRLGGAALTSIAAPHLNAMYADIRENGRIRGQGPLAPSTVLRAHVILHKAFADAVRWGYLDHNPADAADPPSQRVTDSARRGAIRIWTAEQVKRFETVIAEQSGQLYALWLLVALTGLRRSEALGLRWMDVDLPRARVSVRQVIVKVGSRAVVKDAPKSEHGYRAVDIGPKLVAVLRARESEQLDERMAAGREWEDNDLVFAHPTVGPRGVPPGRWWYPDHATHRINELIADSGLPRIRPLQDLRHTHASLLLAAGEPPKVVQERLGHHSPAFTQSTYQHLLPGMGEAAARRFEALVLEPDEGETAS
jgi:integrase